MSLHYRKLWLAVSGSVALAAIVAGQMPSPADRAAIAAASAAERSRELKLLGITALQTPVSAYDNGNGSPVANFDESKANPYPKLPDLLTMNDGKKVTTPAQWKKRRAEIAALFDENIYGKYPAYIPSMTWKVDSVETTSVQGIDAVVKHVTGRADNSAAPWITVEMHIDVVTPASTKGRKVPVIIGGGSVKPPFRFPPPVAGQPVHLLSAPADPPNSAKLLLQHGWGFVGRSSTDVQADNGAGLDKGIIGLANKGQPRKLDDWGVLRAWAWGDSRILDYLQTDPDVNGRKVGVMGHSRGGKAALVAMVDDPRFAIAYISSSGAGGAELYRRNYGETVANLAGVNEYHWFAGNFMRYAAVGHTPNEMPVDSHEFIAMAAPRPIFIGGGALITDPKYAPGDAWQDTQGMFMATAAGCFTWNILGAKGLGTSIMPPMGTLIDTGDVAFRQHEYGHTPAPNWPYFIQFADKELAEQK